MVDREKWIQEGAGKTKTWSKEHITSGMHPPKTPPSTHHLPMLLSDI